MMNKPIRIGLMGCGTVANYGHIPAIQQVPDMELHAVYDPHNTAFLYSVKNRWP